jgi:hypothetical protein
MECRDESGASGECGREGWTGIGGISGNGDMDGLDAEWERMGVGGCAECLRLTLVPEIDFRLELYPFFEMVRTRGVHSPPPPASPSHSLSLSFSAACSRSETVAPYLSPLQTHLLHQDQDSNWIERCLTLDARRCSSGAELLQAAVSGQTRSFVRERGDRG